MMVLAILAIALGGLISILNWVSLFQSIISKKFISSVPLFGALLLGIGLAYFEKTRPYAILCIVADYGTLVLIISLPHLIREFWRVSRFNLIRTYVGTTQEAKYQLNLYRKGVFVIEVNFEPPRVGNEHGSRIVGLGFQGKWREEGGVIECCQYEDDRVLKLVDEGGTYFAEESNYPEDKQYQYDRLEGIRFVVNPKGGNTG